MWEEVKRWSSRFINLQETCEEEAKKIIEGGQPEKKYRKISKWLRGYKDNQIIAIL
ncbi:hypothetical protein RhiirA4_404112 [Rhizophagus irregularis]|nr:hypothetical protein RhiirA4_404112 [Rhizophagus irregularis]